MGNIESNGDREAPNAPQTLTPERIQDETGYKLAITFPGFTQEDRYVSPDVHEERERLSGQFGEDNVMTSFYEEGGVIKLGIFFREG